MNTDSLNTSREHALVAIGIAQHMIKLRASAPDNMPPNVRTWLNEHVYKAVEHMNSMTTAYTSTIVATNKEHKG